MIQLTFYSGLPYPVGDTWKAEIMAPTLAKWEDKIGAAFGGFTKFKATGYWENMVGDSVVYVVVFEELAYPTWEYMVKQAKLSLAEALGQSEILVTWVRLGGLI